MIQTGGTHSPRMRINLVELNLVVRDRVSSNVEYDESSTRGALVNGSNKRGHFSPCTHTQSKLGPKAHGALLHRSKCVATWGAPDYVQHEQRLKVYSHTAYIIG